MALLEFKSTDFATANEALKIKKARSIALIVKAGNPISSKEETALAAGVTALISAEVRKHRKSNLPETESE